DQQGESPVMDTMPISNVVNCCCAIDGKQPITAPRIKLVTNEKLQVRAPQPGSEIEQPWTHFMN
ncbi:MAG TPA: hypothetical protein VN843_09065, partial [Anaerolineales bacterium]|nr:hypothetical protein [Anaerolineales bacterium]